MLQPTDRRLLFDALAPPTGFKLDFAVGTTYTLDLFALLSAPVAFAFSDWQDRDGRPTGDPLALLKAVREYADRMCLFFQAGRIHVPHNYQPLLASIESSLVETLAPRGGSFHPKVWFLRFAGSEGEVMYRFLCLSRNMTFDRAWDTMLCLEGPLTDRTNAFTQNHPLGRFVESLPNIAIRGVSKSWKKRIDDLAFEIRRVDFEKPDMVEQLQFWPIGIDPDSDPEKDWPFGQSKRTLVISPFLSGTALTDLASTGSQIELVSRAEQLERVKPEILQSYLKVWILDDTAEPEPSETEESNAGAGGENASAQPTAPALVGLHAKLYVLDNGWESSVFTGSANATHDAFNRNVEFLTELRGKKSKLGVAAVLGEATDPEETKPGAASLADLLRPFKPGDGAAIEKSTEANFERLVDEIAKLLAKAELSAECQEASDESGFCICLQPSRRTKVVLDPAFVVSVRPASRPHAPFVRLDVDEATWARFDSLAMLSLTSFYVFRVETDSPKRMAREFVLSIPLTNEPSGRREALLKHLLSDKERVLRFLMLLLSDADADAFANMFNGTDGGSDSFQFSSLLNGPTLFESLMKCVERDPARLEQVAEIISDLEKSSDGRELLPKDLEAIWRPIWNVAQRQLARGSKRGKE
ncbi:MAG: phospholipase D family protein [Pirellula sp.]|nr:phospholipase D family protein [Pirellula sp.]